LGWVILLKAQRIGRLCGVADKDVGGGRAGEGWKKHGYYTSLSLSLSLSLFPFFFNNWSHLIWRLQVSERHYIQVFRYR
jgi:hypothetical protein